MFYFVKNNWRAIDLYSVSICFITILKAYKLGEANTDYLFALANELMRGISADPTKRPSVGQVNKVARKAISGGSRADITGLLTVRKTALANRKIAAVTLRGSNTSISRTTTHLLSKKTE